VGVDYDFKILNAVMDINQIQKTRLIDKAKQHFGGNLKGKHIAMWGLAFKPYTDDIREAPALYNIDALLAEGATVSVYDPEGMKNVRELVGDKISYCVDEYHAAEKADAIFIMTEWPIFRTPDFEKLSSVLSSKVIFDGRNLYEPEAMAELGYSYYSIGRKDING
jgi:UDPglucose 6-dehydrogenase